MAIRSQTIENLSSTSQFFATIRKVRQTPRKRKIVIDRLMKQLRLPDVDGKSLIFVAIGGNLQSVFVA